ncbi:MAG: hypothetical protein ACREPT_12370 [Rudaea sp.]
MLEPMSPGKMGHRGRCMAKTCPHWAYSVVAGNANVRTIGNPSSMKSTSGVRQGRHPMTALKRAILVLASMLAIPASAQAQSGTGLQKQVIFDTYSPLARDTELIDRLFHPLLAEHLRGKLASAGSAVREQSIDLA